MFRQDLGLAKADGGSAGPEGAESGPVTTGSEWTGSSPAAKAIRKDVEGEETPSTDEEGQTGRETGNGGSRAAVMV